MSNVLIIEDDSVLSEMYQDIFEKNDFEVHTERDGEHGLAYALQYKPKLILLDLALPKMDGVTVLEKLRSDTWGTKALVMVITNLNIDGKLLDSIIRSRPAYCLMKVGVTPSEIIAKANELLAQSQTGQTQ